MEDISISMSTMSYSYDLSVEAKGESEGCSYLIFRLLHDYLSILIPVELHVEL